MTHHHHHIRLLYVDIYATKQRIIVKQTEMSEMSYDDEIV